MGHSIILIISNVLKEETIDSESSFYLLTHKTVSMQPSLCMDKGTVKE